MRYYLFFRNTRRFIKHFLPSGFSHVGVVFKKDGKWIQFEDTAAYEIILHPVLQDMHDDDYVRALCHDDCYSVLSLDVIPTKRLRFWSRFNIISPCVHSVIHLMGLNMWCLTPYGLYKKLMKMQDLSYNFTKKYGIANIREIM